MIPYTITRSKRKTMAIHITKDAAVEVRAPLKLAKSEIDKFVQSKEKWITEHLAIQADRIAKKSAFSLNYGDTVSVMGKPYAINTREGNRIGYTEEAFYMPPGLNNEQIKYTCVQIYKLVAKSELIRRVVDYAKRMEVEPTNVKINSATTRWGSCSSRQTLLTPSSQKPLGQSSAALPLLYPKNASVFGAPIYSINFSWRLIMADDDVIDYVVVHELAHIKEHNHSPKFWAVVESVLPDYKLRQKKLKELQAKLAKENWE